jgi:hypothetical protein
VNTDTSILACARALKRAPFCARVPTVRQRTVDDSRLARVGRQLKREPILAANIPGAVLVAMAGVVAGALPAEDLVGVDTEAVVEVAGPRPAGDFFDDGSGETVSTAGEDGGGESEDGEEGCGVGGELHGGLSEDEGGIDSGL